jgi:hypothetical protein
VWQRWYEQQSPDIPFLAVAADAQGPAVVLPWLRDSAVSYAVAVDAENKLGAIFGYGVVPNGIFVDEAGVLRHLSAGDFTVSNPQMLSQVDRFLAGDADVLAELTVDSQARLSRLEQELLDSKVRLASEMLATGRKEAALVELDRALELDPENFVIRKQRWLLRYPERFEGEIDFDWQDEQLAREREQEQLALGGECGPDGCPIPWAKPPDQTT